MFSNAFGQIRDKAEYCIFKTDPLYLEHIGFAVHLHCEGNVFSI